jgi:hypothetical protein
VPLEDQFTGEKMLVDEGSPEGSCIKDIQDIICLIGRKLTTAKVPSAYVDLYLKQMFRDINLQGEQHGEKLRNEGIPGGEILLERFKFMRSRAGDLLKLNQSAFMERDRAYRDAKVKASNPSQLIDFSTDVLG